MNIKYYVFIFLLFSMPNLFSQTSREVISFNDNWEFKKGEGTNKEISITEANWETVTIPHTYNAEDMQTTKQFYTGDAFYRKKFKAQKAWQGKRVFLRFEGVGNVAKVYVNGKFLTEHKGAYSAFSFEVTKELVYGVDNTILVKTNNDARADVIPVNHFLFPIYGGIYRPVSLIVTNSVNITVTDYASPGVYITQDNVSKKNADIHVKVKLENKESVFKTVVLRTVVNDRDGKVVKTIQSNVTVSPQGMQIANQSFTLNKPHLWQGVKDPYLYTLTTSILENDKELDAVVQPLGVRTIQLKAGEGVFLNGEKYNMYGVTRHQDRWGFGSALSKTQEDEDMALMEEMGVTTVRLAHYQQSEHIYSLADKIGFLVWAEIPFVNTYTKEESENAKQQMVELIRQNFNHPSIYIWGLHNEVYAKTSNEYVAVLTKELNDIAKTNDPNRYTGAVSGYGAMDKPANLMSDLQGMNRYYGWYEGQIGDLKQWAEGLEEKYPNYLVMLTEYGADGNIDQPTERLPLVKDIDPVNGQFSPEAYHTETHIQQWAIIEQHPYILASYLWNMFEFATPMWNRGGVKARNLKGLITFDRKQKKDSFFWYKANWNPEPMLYIANRRDSIRTQSETSVQVFSNAHKVTLTVNSKTFEGKQGVNVRHWVFDNVVLQKGDNHIEAIGEVNGKFLSDTITWKLK
ncbi:glycoside hydrolase family 2 protein [Aestuariibaculum marinum]|uniref:Beta-galactosidase n=1 Tax=Aestuariibaculum marinum TaxID=2683592 RepID=A0A8J6Q018_9FLAO|nr:glycoside hydrolase family 2 TIM barrel-domain containing protein [Aestuariibaculum marinum]MBD0825397.1 beta-galactosidase [Aestuariibaculum marinum]